MRTLVLQYTDELYEHLEVEVGLDRDDGVGVQRLQLALPSSINNAKPLVLAYLREHEVTADDSTRRCLKKRPKSKAMCASIF